MIRILAISGSLRTGSYNTALLHAAKTLAPEGIEIILFGRIGDFPHFNPDIDTDEPPIPIEEFRHQLQLADAILISSPEYAHGIPGVLKNVLDWIVGNGEIVNKPVGIINATPSWTGALKAQESLIHILTVMSTRVIPEAVISIPAVREKINEKGVITDPQIQKALKASINALVCAVRPN